MGSEKIAESITALNNAIKAKFGQDNSERKRFSALINSVDDRIWRELRELTETITHITGAGGSGGSGGVSSVNGRTGAVTLDKTDVGLPNVDNTADADKPVSTAQQAALNSLAVRVVEVDGVWDNSEGVVNFIFPSNCVEAFVYVQMGTSYTWDWHIPYTSGPLPIALKQTSNQTTEQTSNANKLYCTLTTDGTKASARMVFSGGVEPDVMKMVCLVRGI
jgi:hypothetical protein